MSLNQQEGEILHEHTPSEGTIRINTIRIKNVCSFDSILDSSYRKYTLCGTTTFR